MDSRRIDHIQTDAMQIDGLMQGISGGSGNLRDNGSVLSQQHIQQRRFSGIGLSNNNCGYAFFH